MDMPLLDEDFIGPDGPDDEAVNMDENDENAEAFPDTVYTFSYSKNPVPIHLYVLIACGTRLLPLLHLHWGFNYFLLIS